MCKNFIKICKNVNIFYKFYDIMAIVGVNMERFVFKKLTEWKKSKDRKPLILQGARQVG